MITSVSGIFTKARAGALAHVFATPNSIQSRRTLLVTVVRQGTHVVEQVPRQWAGPAVGANPFHLYIAGLGTRRPSRAAELV